MYAKLNQERSILIILAVFATLQIRQQMTWGNCPFHSAVWLGVFCFLGLIGIVNIESLTLGGWRKNRKAVNGELSGLHARDSWSGCLYSQCNKRIGL